MSTKKRKTTSKKKSSHKKLPQQVRQGDVLLDPVAFLPNGAKRTANGHIVLALGRATGHTHEVTHPKATLHVLGEARYLQLPVAAELVHQEHATITLAAGVYRVVRQREISALEVRNVED